MTDRDYVRQRNRLIPQATIFANEKCGKDPSISTAATRERWYFEWNTTFYKKMDELARENGLIT